MSSCALEMLSFAINSSRTLTEFLFSAILPADTEGLVSSAKAGMSRWEGRGRSVGIQEGEGGFWGKFAVGIRFSRLRECTQGMESISYAVEDVYTLVYAPNNQIQGVEMPLGNGRKRVLETKINFWTGRFFSSNSVALEGRLVSPPLDATHFPLPFFSPSLQLCFRLHI